MARFHNPYNFIPNADRTEVDRPFGDAIPVGHGSQPVDRFRGTLTVKMTTRTRLFISDASRQESRDGHVTLPLRVNGNEVHIPPTSVKGMLRSAYETVTLSRYGVMNLSDPLGYRPQTRSALDTIPFRVVSLTADKIAFDLYTGSYEEDVHAAAWIPIHEAHRIGHGSLVKATVGRYRYQRGRRQFQFYAVTHIDGESINPRIPGAAHSLGEEAEVEGYVYVTSRDPNRKNFPKKHHERLFFDFKEPIRVEFEGADRDRIVRRWKSLIADYQEAAQQESGKRWDFGAHQRSNKVWDELHEGSLGYARVIDGAMEDVQPVMISRRLFDLSPMDLARSVGMDPATSIDELSMADRVFGWVSQDSSLAEAAAFKGKISIGPVENTAVESSRESVTLAILSTPRPSYGRFYTGPKGGVGWKPGLGKEDASYDADGAVLRGRKVYPHQIKPAYKGQYAATQDRGKQNRTMRGWVKEGSEFTFAIRFEGLDAVEVGALIWAIDPHADGKFAHKLGSAKPFGYGSVTLEIADQAIESHDAVSDRWSGRAAEAVAPPDFREAFADAFLDATGQRLEEHPTTSTFLKYGRGLSGAVHYPGSGAQYKGQYEWFVANDRGRGVSLPALGEQLDG